MILAERTARRAAEARAEDAEAQISGARLEIERLKLLLAKARREQYGQSSERGAKIIAQLELQLAELEETVAQEDTAAEMAAPAGPAPRSTPQRKPARRPLPAHLPRERIVHPAPCACPKCGGVVRKLGEDVTETLECVPRRWKVVEHVREKFTCRSCEAITQPPAPSHPIARGRAGPNLLALVMVSKYGHHLPLARQSAIYAREGVEIDVSTLADWVGATAATAMPLVDAIHAHVFAAKRLHADDTTVPVLAKDKTRIARLWAYVRDDRPFAGRAPPAVHKGMAYRGEHLAIIDQRAWDKAHAVMAPPAHRRGAASRAKVPALLKGLIFGPNGRPMSPSHTRRRGRIYRYYVTREAISEGYETCPVTSVPAADVEGAVLDHVRRLLLAPELVARTWATAKRDGDDGITEREVTALLADFAMLWNELFPAEQARIVQLLVERVDIQEDALEVRIRASGLPSLVAELQQGDERPARAA